MNNANDNISIPANLNNAAREWYSTLTPLQLWQVVVDMEDIAHNTHGKLCMLNAAILVLQDRDLDVNLTRFALQKATYYRNWALEICAA